MRRWLRAMSDATWDHLGVLAGSVACATIVHQIIHERRTPGPSSVSLWFVGGFLLVYVFWCLYGVRFSRRAIWLSNGVAAILQVIFALVVVMKA